MNNEQEVKEYVQRAKNMKQMRKLMGLTQIELSGIIKMDQTNYCHAEKMRQPFSDERYNKTVQVFKQWRNEKVFELKKEINTLNGLTF